MKIKKSKLLELFYDSGEYQENGIKIVSWFDSRHSKKYVDVITTSQDGKRKEESIVINGMTLEQFEALLVPIK